MKAHRITIRSTDLTTTFKKAFFPPIINYQALEVPKNQPPLGNIALLVDNPQNLPSLYTQSFWLGILRINYVKRNFFSGSSDTSKSVWGWECVEALLNTRGQYRRGSVKHSVDSLNLFAIKIINGVADTCQQANWNKNENSIFFRVLCISESN